MDFFSRLWDVLLCTLLAAVSDPGAGRASPKGCQARLGSVQHMCHGGWGSRVVIPVA